MSVNFSIYKTPRPHDQEGNELQHARVITQGTKRIDEICEYINESSSLTSADIKGTIEALFNYISTQLLNGYNVDLEGFGNFSLSLRSKQVENELGEKLTNVSINGIHFKCAKRLRERIIQGNLSKKARTECELAPFEKRKEKMISYLQKNEYINGTLYSELNSCSMYYANKDIKQYLQEGIILQIGKNKHNMYILPKPKEKE